MSGSRIWRVLPTPLMCFRVAGLACGLFLRCQRADAECVDVGLHQRIDSGIDQAMSCNGGQACKCFRHDPHREMAAATGSARMTGVQMAVVFYLELLRLKCLLQRVADFLDAVHGMVLMNGWTSICE